MTIKYALLDPATGQYEYFDSEADIKIKLAERALAFYLTHGHGVAYNTVTTDENGWETWSSSSAVTSIDEAEIIKEIQSKL
jgi:hypothetical protein